MSEKPHFSPDPLLKAEERLRLLAEPLALVVSRRAASGSRLTLDVADERGVCTFHVEKARGEAPHFRRAAGLVVWYAVDETKRPPWLSALLGPAADALVATPHLAEALGEPAPEGRAAFGPFPRRTGLDLVRAGLKPATSMLVGSGHDPRTDDLPFVVLSRVSLARDARGDLVPADPGQEGACRMLYAGHERKTVERLRDLDEALVKARLTQGVRGSADLQEELGRLLGYPPCCTRAFVEAERAPSGSADLHASLCRRDRALHAIDPRQNHVLAHFYDLPFLLHVPCHEGCEATADLVDRAVDALYPPFARQVIREVLAHGALVYPDDRVVFFEPLGAPEGDGVAVRAFNVDPHPEALPLSRAAERCVAKDRGAEVRDAEVTGVVLRNGQALVRARTGLFPYGEGARSSGVGPLVLLPRRR